MLHTSSSFLTSNSFKSVESSAVDVIGATRFKTSLDDSEWHQRHSRQTAR